MSHTVHKCFIEARIRCAQECEHYAEVCGRMAGTTGFRLSLTVSQAETATVACGRGARQASSRWPSHRASYHRVTFTAVMLACLKDSVKTLRLESFSNLTNP